LRRAGQFENEASHDRCNDGKKPNMQPNKIKMQEFFLVNKKNFSARLQRYWNTKRDFEARAPVCKRRLTGCTHEYAQQLMA